MSIDHVPKSERVSRILIAYASMAGSTAEVAAAVGEEFKKNRSQVEIIPMEKVTDLAGFDAVILGAPMIMGWHRSALRFLRKHQGELERMPLAVFALAMSLTSTGETSVDGVPVCVDQNLSKPPVKAGHLTLKENHTNLNHYASSILNAAGRARPVSLAIFGGRLDYFRLKLLAKLFVMLVVQAQPGDRRDWKVIRSWAGSLPQLFNSRNDGD
jgi:menaquinone-dependent protoporphyrinogen IX oxidase